MLVKIFSIDFSKYSKKFFSKKVSVIFVPSLIGTFLSKDVENFHGRVAVYILQL